MKHTLLFLALFISISAQAQEKVQIIQEGFRKNDVLLLFMNGGRQSLKTNNELIFEMEGNLTQPMRGQIVLKSGKYSAFYIEPGATKVIIKKKGFPQSTDVPGSKSHEVYQKISFGEGQELIADMQQLASDSIALQTFDSKFKFKKFSDPVLKDIYAQISEPNRKYTPTFAAYIETLDIPKPEEGTMLYDFVGADVNGKSFNTEDYRGKYLLLDFAATGCGPCWAGYPDMQEQVAKYENLEVITFNEDDQIEAWKSISKERNVNLEWPVLWSATNKEQIFEIYDVEGWPKLYLISPIGEVLDWWYGSASSIIRKKLRKHID